MCAESKPRPDCLHLWWHMQQHGHTLYYFAQHLFTTHNASTSTSKLAFHCMATLTGTPALHQASSRNTYKPMPRDIDAVVDHSSLRHLLTLTPLSDSYARDETTHSLEQEGHLLMQHINVLHVLEPGPQHVMQHVARVTRIAVAGQPLQLRASTCLLQILQPCLRL